MHYLLFNKDILISDGEKVQHIRKDDDPERLLGKVEEARICVVDVDVLLAASMESPIEKKDNLLVRKFRDYYPQEAYIIQDEKIDHHLFQVIGIREKKVREIYSLLPSSKIGCLVPYGLALRNTLVQRGIDLKKTVVFVDDQGSERLLTVFDGLKFSRTRVIANNGEDILPEIKRSQIDFFKKNEEFLSGKRDFLVVINSQSQGLDISQNEEKPPVECLNMAYPALEGLKEIDTLISYRLPEEILKKRRAVELKRNIAAAAFSLCLIAIGLCWFLWNRFDLALSGKQYNLANLENARLTEQLTSLDKAIYRGDLMKYKSLNYAIPYLALLDLIPSNYEVDSFRFIRSDRWSLEMTLSLSGGGGYDSIPKIKILRNADIKDVFVNDRPGKRLKVVL